MLAAAPALRRTTTDGAFPQAMVPIETAADLGGRSSFSRHLGRAVACRPSAVRGCALARRARSGGALAARGRTARAARGGAEEAVTAARGNPRAQPGGLVGEGRGEPLSH